MKHSNIFLIESKAGFTDELGYMANMFCHLDKVNAGLHKVGAFYKIYLKYIYNMWGQLFYPLQKINFWNQKYFKYQLKNIQGHIV